MKQAFLIFSFFSSAAVLANEEILKPKSTTQQPLKTTRPLLKRMICNPYTAATAVAAASVIYCITRTEEGALFYQETKKRFFEKAPEPSK